MFHQNHERILKKLAILVHLGPFGISDMILLETTEQFKTWKVLLALFSFGNFDVILGFGVYRCSLNLCI